MRIDVRDAPGGDADLVLVPGQNLVTGENELVRQLESDLTSLERDFLTLAAAVYAADLAARRDDREHVCRLMEVAISVVNLAAMESVRADLQYALHLLSRDTWSLVLSRAPGAQEGMQPWQNNQGTTLLFSGGLDSLAAAVDLLSKRVPLYLVSHYTGNQTTSASQTDLLSYLGAQFGAVDCVRVRTGGRTSGALTFPADNERESSQRTRSFLFIALASIVGRRTGHRNLLMVAENGPLAIHAALSTARLGPFSTHTAHPEFLEVMSGAVSSLLGVPLTISNPFLYSTKAEVVRDLVSTHPAAISLSVSCWRGSRQAINHCGECVPCFIRRFALEKEGFRDDEYARDLLQEEVAALDPDDEGLRNLVDLLEFSSAWATETSESVLVETFPELINGAIDQGRAVQMYRRFGSEVTTVASSYPAIANLLK